MSVMVKNVMVAKIMLSTPRVTAPGRKAAEIATQSKFFSKNDSQPQENRTPNIKITDHDFELCRSFS